MFGNEERCLWSSPILKGIAFEKRRALPIHLPIYLTKVGWHIPELVSQIVGIFWYYQDCNVTRFCSKLHSALFLIVIDIVQTEQLKNALQVEANRHDVGVGAATEGSFLEKDWR